MRLTNMLRTNVIPSLRPRRSIPAFLEAVLKKLDRGGRRPTKQSHPPKFAIASRLSALAMTLFAFISFTNLAYAQNNNPTLEKATFAGGCFWCMQPFFDKTKGVKETQVGYTGGQTKNPTYEEVSSGTTGHAEAIEITYDPALVSYEKLLNIYWRNIDPTTKDGQFFDKGTQYRTAIFYHSEEQKKIAEKSRDELAASGKFKKPIVTEIVAASEFYPAEDYHQKYYKKNALRYKAYSAGSGRDNFFKKIWGKDAK